MEAIVGNLIKVKAKRGKYLWYKVISINELDYLCITFNDHILNTESPETISVNKKDVLEVIQHESVLL